MKECDNSKIHISSNFILSISLLIMFDTILLKPSLHCNTPLHFTTLHPTILHYTPLHFTQLHFTTLQPTTLHYASPHFTQLYFTTLHFATIYHNWPNYTSPHFATLHHTSPHFTQLHFTTLIDTLLPLIYTSLPHHLASRIYISYRSISPHITKLDTVQFSSPNFFPKQWTLSLPYSYH
jgi:hypothetical protein